MTRACCREATKFGSAYRHQIFSKGVQKKSNRILTETILAILLSTWMHAAAVAFKSVKNKEEREMERAL